MALDKGEDLDGTASDLYSSSENSPESHHRLLHHHHQHHAVHQQQMLASRLSPVSPANDEHHYQQHMLHHHQQQQQHSTGISVISGAQSSHHGLVHPPEEESASNGYVFSKCFSSLFRRCVVLKAKKKCNFRVTPFQKNINEMSHAYSPIAFSNNAKLPRDLQCGFRGRYADLAGSQRRGFTFARVFECSLPAP